MGIIHNRSALIKSLVRGIVAAGGAIAVAANTWLSNGHSFGFNKETALGIVGTAAFPIIATLSRYLDRTDPAFGFFTHAAAAAAVKKISDATDAKPTA